LVSTWLPPAAPAEAQAPAGEDVHRSRLLGYQRGLPLGQDDDTGDELEAPRAGRQIAEENEDLVEGALVRVRRGAPELVEALSLAAQHVGEDEQGPVPGLLRSLGVVPED